MADTVVSTPASLEALFNRPSIEDFRQSNDFVAFVAYVFERAGYAVKDVGAQYWSGVFELYAGGEIKGRPSAYAWAKQSPDLRIGQGLVAEWVGALALHGAAPGPRYIVTAVGFTDEAQKAAAGTPHLHLIDGEHLARYVAYVRDTRHEHARAHVISPDHLFYADAIRRRDTRQTKVLTIANNKGGEGKTTTALYLARRLAEHGKRVLLVDLDAQANLTESLPPKQGSSEQLPHLADYFTRRRQLHQLIWLTQLSNVWLIPAHRDLRLVDTGATPSTETDLQFVADLHGPEIRPPTSQGNEQFDWMILDTPPDLTRHTRAALAAAHYVLAPTSPGPYGDLGLQQLFDTVNAMRGLMGSEVSMLGCVITKWQEGATHNDALKQLRQSLLIPNGIRVFNEKIGSDSAGI